MGRFLFAHRFSRVEFYSCLWGMFFFAKGDLGALGFIVIAAASVAVSTIAGQGPFDERAA